MAQGPRLAERPITAAALGTYMYSVARLGPGLMHVIQRSRSQTADNFFFREWHKYLDGLKVELGDSIGQQRARLEILHVIRKQQLPP